jgi:phosphate transport system substrate-binding protein
MIIQINMKFIHYLKVAKEYVNGSVKTSIIIVAFVMALYSCNNLGVEKHTDTATTGNAAIATDETFQPIVEAILPVYHAIYKYAKIKVNYLPEVDAINLLLKDSVKLAIVPRPLTANEVSYFNEKQIFPKEVKIALDGIAVLVNKKNTDTLLTVEQLRDIFLGKITRWEQINPSSTLGELKVIFDNPNSSIVRYVVDSITKSNILSDKLSAMKYNRDVVELVSNTPNAIGLIGVSWVSDKDDPACLSFLKNISVVAISKNNKATPENSFQPFQAYIATGKYALTRYIYMINTEPRAGLATGFSAFAAGDKGQRIILKTGILPYTQPVRIIQIKDN